MHSEHCTACGAELVEGASFCSSCGAAVEIEAPLRCASCGAEVGEGASFCANCGAPVEAETSAATTPSGCCSACGAELAEGASFCTSCGAPVETGAPSGCPSCGAEVAEGASFCTNCGAPVEPAAPAARGAPVSPVQAFLPQIEADIQRRRYTDRPVSALPFGWTIWKRRNEHFARQRSFYGHVIEALQAHGRATNDHRLLATVEEAAVLLDEAAVAEPEKNPWVHSFLGGSFRLPELFTDFRRHSLRQLGLNEMISEALRLALDPRISIEDMSLVPDRSGFRIWFRSLGPEVNDHFAWHALAEDQIVYYLRMLAAKPPVRRAAAPARPAVGAPGPTRAVQAPPPAAPAPTATRRPRPAPAPELRPGAPIGANEWPMEGLNPQRTSGDESALPYDISAPPKWKASVPAPRILGVLWQALMPVHSSPIVVGDSVYFGTGREWVKGRLVALDRHTGKRRWYAKFDSAVEAGPVFKGGVLYAGARNGALYAVEAASGRMLWQVTASARTFVDSPTAGEDLVYIGTQEGSVFALDSASGQERWRHDLGAPIEGTTLLADGRLYFIGGDNAVYALDAASGRVVWKADSSARLSQRRPSLPISSGPSAQAGTLLVPAANALLALDAQSGGHLWEWKAPEITELGFMLTPVVGGGSVYVAYTSSEAMEGDGYLAALDLGTGAEAWKTRFPSDRFYKPPALAAHHLLIATHAGLHGTLFAVDRRTGAEVGRRSGFPIHCTPAIMAGTVYYAEQGKFQAV